MVVVYNWNWNVKGVQHVVIPHFLLHLRGSYLCEYSTEGIRKSWREIPGMS